MPSKKFQGPSLYRTFVDAYMRARPDEKRNVSFSVNEAKIVFIDIK